MKKRLLSFTLSLAVIIASISSFSISANATSYEDSLRKAGFPESYISSLTALHNKYPNWSFKVFDVGVSLSDAVNGERSTHSHQVIRKSSSTSSDYYCNCSSCFKNGNYVYQEGSNVSASTKAVAYYMNPTNWLTEQGIFQFESSKYSSSQTISGVEAVLSSTFMHDDYISYKNVDGNISYVKIDGKKVKYSTAIMTAAKESGLSAYYLASKIVQEIGSTSQNVGGTCGTREPFKQIFNYYSIGAYGGASDGLHWADGKMWATKETTLYSNYDATTKKASGTKTKVPYHSYLAYMSYVSGDYVKVKMYTKKGTNSYSTDGAVGYVLKADTDLASLSYGRPWNTPYKSIVNGAKYIADGYLEYQYTTYLQKFNVNKNTSSMYSHEYLTNVTGAVDASKLMYKCYKDSGIITQARTFYIPVYTSLKMPEDASSTTTTTTTTVAPAPIKVTGLKLTSRGLESLKIKWDAVPGATKYDIYIKNKKTDKVYHKYVTTNTATLKNLTLKNSYIIKVRAYKGKYQAYSNSITEYTGVTKPPILTPATNSKHQIIVKWSKVSCNGYKVQFSKTKDFKKVITTKDAKNTATSYTGKNFTKGKTYYVRVRAYKTVNDKKVYSSWSAVKKIVSK